MVGEIKERFPKTHLNTQFLLRMKFRATDATLLYQLLRYAANHAKMHKHIGVYIIILSNKTSFSDTVWTIKLPQGQVKLCKNLLFLDFHRPKLHINMPFIYSKSVEKQSKHSL